MREKLVPQEALVAESDQIPDDIVRDMKALGLLGMSIPEAYGGMGLSMGKEVMAGFEIAHTSPAFRSLFATNNGLSADDVDDALQEIRHRVQVSFGRVLPKSSMYAEFDRYWQPWDPATDAFRLAADLVNDPEMPSGPKEIAERYGWTPRRLNPAITYLQERDLIRVYEALASGPFVTIRVTKTDATRRFAKSRG